MFKFLRREAGRSIAECKLFIYITDFRRNASPLQMVFLQEGDRLARQSGMFKFRRREGGRSIAECKLFIYITDCRRNASPLQMVFWQEGDRLGRMVGDRSQTEETFSRKVSSDAVSDLPEAIVS